MTPRYSFLLCRSDCRRRLAQRLCGCTPFFYRRIDATPVCNERQMLCLANYSDTLISLVDQKSGIKVECDCLPLCEEVTYALEKRDDEYNSGRKDIAVIRFGIRKYPHIRLKRDIIFGFTDLLVAVGGTAGLFLGCSVLSFVEIAYFFTLRLFWYFVQSKQAKAKGKMMKK